MKRAWKAWLPGALLLAAAAGTARAGPVQNPIAVFAGLDKITGLITTFEVPVDETRRFGSLNVRPRVCNTRPVTEPPKTTSFVEVDDNQLNGELKRIFSGWMLAESPGLNAVEHPVYDVWLTGCRDPKALPPEQEVTPEADIEKENIPKDND